LKAAGRSAGGRPAEATAIFNELSKVSVASEIKKRIVGIIRTKNGAPKLYRGTVVKKNEGYLFVAVDGFKEDIFGFRGEVHTKDWGQIKRGSDVETNIGFTYRG